MAEMKRGTLKSASWLFCSLTHELNFSKPSWLTCKMRPFIITSELLKRLNKIVNQVASCLAHSKCFFMWHFKIFSFFI